MNRKLLILSLMCFSIFCTQQTREIEHYNPEWELLHPGIWKHAIGETDKLSYRNLSKARSRERILDTMANTPFPLNINDIFIEKSGSNIVVRMPLQRDEQIYGLGLQFKSVHRRGQLMRLHVDHYDNADNGRTHAPVPFFVSSLGYGVFIDAARYIDIYIGTGVRKDSKNPPKAMDRNTDSSWSSRPYSDNIEIVIPGDEVSFFIFAGPEVLQTVQRFNLFCGGGVIPPKWGLGFWQRTPTLYSSQDVLKEIKEFNKWNFPLDVIGLEPGWHSAAYPCTFEWDPKRFPHPAAFVDTLNNLGVRVNLWMNPYISPESVLFDTLNPWSGTHTVWNGIVPDYTLETPRKIMKEHLRKNQLDIGISGFKIDEVDGYDVWLWPDAARFPSGADGEQMRQVYGLLCMNLVEELYREKNLRTYGLVRAANAGAVNMPFVIYNDYYSHRDFITALVNSSFSGILWTPEVRSSKTGEEWLRRFQTVCFSPMAMINAWQDGTKPWSFPEVFKDVRDHAHLRMQLIPYLYTTFADYYFKGIPPFRAMVLEKNFLDNSKEQKPDSLVSDYVRATRQEIKDQYMMGEQMLVAPLFDSELQRTVILPKGNWYDFYTGHYVGNGEIITVSPGLEKIPVFVKDGAVIPMVKSRRRAPATSDTLDLILHYYGSAPGQYQLYDDDGTSYDFERGAYSLTRFSVKNWNGKPETEIVREREGPYFYKNETWKFMAEKQGS